MARIISHTNAGSSQRCRRPLAAVLICLLGAAAPAAVVADGYSTNGPFGNGAGNSLADQTRLWAAMSGSTLKDTLDTWAQAAGWTVVWDTETNYGLRASATFAGTFMTAVTDLVDTIHLDNPELTVTIYTGNRVVHIQTLLNETR